MGRPRRNHHRNRHLPPRTHGEVRDEKSRKSSNKRNTVPKSQTKYFPTDLPPKNRGLSELETQGHTIHVRQQAMDGQGDCEHYIFPKNPHTKTNAQVEETSDDGFESAPGIAPILTFAIESSHPIVAHWDEVSERTAELLDKAGVRWLAIECFRRRQQNEQTEDDATVVITTEGPTLITDDFRGILNKIHDISGKLYVEVVRGQLWPYASQDNDEKDWLKGLIPYSKQTPMGGSIGVSEKPRSSGTIGGFLELFKGEDVKLCGLTCHHVTKSRSGTKEEKNSGRGLNRVFHPSSVDHNHAVAKTKKMIQEQKDDQVKIGNEWADAGYSDLDVKRTLDSMSSDIANWEEEVNSAVSFNREVGSIFARSGLRKWRGKQPCRIDWAVVELKRDRAGQNKYYSSQNRERKLQGFRSPWTWEVSKTGRTTGQTDGRINGVQSLVSAGDRGRKLESKEWVIVPTTTNNHPGGPPAFAWKGDSGSFVVAKALPDVIGILWGGCVTTGVCFMTPIQVVAKDILSKTGYHVRLPDGPHICCG